MLDITVVTLSYAKRNWCQICYMIVSLCLFHLTSVTSSTDPLHAPATSVKNIFWINKFVMLLLVVGKLDAWASCFLNFLKRWWNRCLQLFYCLHRNTYSTWVQWPCGNDLVIFHFMQYYLHRTSYQFHPCQSPSVCVQLCIKACKAR